MRAGASFACLAAAGAVACVAFGCVLVTGSTSGYTLADGGGPAVVDAGACTAESGVCFATQCLSAAQCASGQVCCLGAASAAGFTCQTSCAFGTVQVCTTSSECSSAGSCIEQQCTIAPTTYDLKLCGLAPGCVEVTPAADGGPADASGASDASHE